MNRKGQFTAFLPYILVGIIIVFIFAIATIPIAYVGDKVFDELNESSAVGESSNTTRGAINAVSGFMIPAFDQVVFFTLIAIFIGTIIIAIFTDFHPVALGVFILTLILIVIIGGVMGDLFDDVTDNSIISSTADEFTFTNVIMGGYQLPMFLGVTVVLAILIILAKRGGATSPV